MPSYPYPVKLDRKTKLTGVFNTPHTDFTLPFTDTTINLAVLSDAHASPGAQHTLVSTSGTNVRALDVDLSAGEVIVGRSFNMLVQLSRIYFRRGQSQLADIKARVTLSKIAISHHNTGAYSFKSVMTNRTTRNKNFSQATNLATDDGELVAWFNGAAKDQTLTLESLDARPVHIGAIKIMGDYEPARGSR